MKSKFYQGQRVIHKLDRRRLMVILILDEPNADSQRYECKFVSNGTYLTHMFREFELEEDKDIV